jgi:hypothetical protein
MMYEGIDGGIDEGIVGRIGGGNRRGGGGAIPQEEQKTSGKHLGGIFYRGKFWGVETLRNKGPGKAKLPIVWQRV